MTTTPELFSGKPDTTADAEPDVVEAVSPPPVLITEQEVTFATAAAVALPAVPPRRGHKAFHVALEAIRGVFATSTVESRPKRRHYPRRTDCFEHSRMAREMYRL